MQRLTVTILAIALGGPAFAQDAREEAIARATDPETGAFPEGWAIGPAFFYKSPVYSARDAVLEPVPAVYYRGERCSVYIKQWSCRVAGRGAFELGVMADLRLDRYDTDDSPIFAGMESRNFSIDAGLSLEFDTPGGDVGIELLTDTLDEHGGTEVSLSWQAPIVLDRWVLRPRLGYHLKSADLADHYYGVRPAEAMAGRPAYRVGSTETWSVGFAGNMRLTRNWLLLILAEYQSYGSEITNSPIVDDSGQSLALVGAARLFGRRANER